MAIRGGNLSVNVTTDDLILEAVSSYGIPWIPTDSQRHVWKWLKTFPIKCPLDIHISFSSLGETKKTLKIISEVHTFPNEQQYAAISLMLHCGLLIRM